MAGRPRKPTSKTMGIPEEVAPLEDYALSDAIARYNSQVDICNRLKRKWESLGRPITAEGGATGRAMVVHPLVKEIQEAEIRADRLLQRTLEKRKPGRPLGAGSAPDRRQPATRLTKVA